MASRALLIGGAGAQTAVSDVISVANGLEIVLEAAAADRIKKSSPPPKSFSADDPTLAAAHDASKPTLSTVASRAACFTKVLNLVHGRSGMRLQVIEYLINALNTSSLSALPVCDEDSAALSQLASSCKAAAGPDGSEIGLSSSERLVLESGVAASAGVGALVVQGGRNLLAAATAAAALSCEAVGAQVKAFEAEVVEALGRKSAISVADELRGLLDGSKQVNTNRKLGEAQAAFSSIPQVCGTAVDALGSAYNMVRAEVQSGALPPKETVPSTSTYAQLATSLLEAARSLITVGKSSLTRLQAVAASSPAAAEHLQALQPSVQQALHAAQQQGSAAALKLFDGSPSPPVLKAALAAQSALDAAHAAVALEAVVAAAVLPPPEPATSSSAANGTELQDASNDAGGKKKDKKKDRKGSSGPVIGKGSSVFRSYLHAQAGTDPSLPTAAPPGDGSARPPSLSISEAYDKTKAALSPLGTGLDKLAAELRPVLEANQARRIPKVPKGTRDYMPADMTVREQAFNIITSVFKRHGAVSIDTPVFEVRETLMGKYGEDSKLIYDLADQGGEILSLRYDLTVPFARYVATNKYEKIKRFHIGKVYRRDQPAMNRGRFREFFQCDFDICGAYPVMVPDSEVLVVLTEILTNLQIGNFTIKLNHRQLLDSMLAIAGVPPQKFRTICSAIDKLDKEPWEAVRREMTEDKGLPGPVADKIGEFVVLNDRPLALLEVLTAPGHPLGEHPVARAALEDLRLLFQYLEAMDSLHRIQFDLSLARGLDYYTGVIYEAVLHGANVGSIAAGGRYDRLVGMFSGKDIPAVGVSIGVERVFKIMQEQWSARAKESGENIRETETQVLVASIGNGLHVERMKLCTKLWAAGIKAEFGYKTNPKMGDQIEKVLEEGIPFMVLFGEDEIKNGIVKVKDIKANQQYDVPLQELISDLHQRLQLF